MRTDYLTFAIQFLVSLGIRLVYEYLKEVQKINKERKPIFLFVFTAMCVLWVSWFTMRPADPFRLDLPDALPWIGLMTFAAGTVLAVGAFIQLRGVENIDHLVTTGLFRRLRLPMYVGFLLWIPGWSIYHGAIVSLTFVVAGIVNVLWWRQLEDKRLEVQFGAVINNIALQPGFRSGLFEGR
jgi:protein-S-isoprenylcysteine O-methyltransferase Ste14